jgi:glyoxylase-like metal-dependent hydrolase (beta-lactamase superfamily II)/rhodanese-related sulfurtransferase
MAAGDVHAIADEALGNASYVVDVGRSEAVVVDPRRDVDAYLRLADRLGLRIVASLETHLHADFVSGSRELAEAVGAKVIAPNGAELHFAHRPMSEGESVAIGDVTFTALHTPGHTPEHVAYLLTDPVRAVFSGGSLLAGGAARTDLSGDGRTRELAEAQFGSLHRLAALPDETALYPSHGGGSFCSTGSGRHTATTVEEERRSNPLLELADEDAFVERLLAGFGSYPPYFLHLRELNRRPPLIEDLARPRPLGPMEVTEAVDGGAWLIDGRSVEEWSAEHPRGAISIAVRPQFASWLGWVVPYGQPVILLVGDEQREEALRLSRLIGYDRIEGWMDGGMDAWKGAGLPTASLEVVAPEEARTRMEDGVTLLDVRQRSEWTTSRIPGALHVELGDIIAGERPGGELIAFCGHGERAATAASLLLRDGGRVANLADGFSGWKRSDLPTEG